MAVNVLII